MAFILLAQNYQNKTLLDDYPRPFSIHFFLASFPLQKIQVLSQPPLQLPMAIGSILGQLDGRDKWLWNLGARFSYLSTRQKGSPSCFLPSCLGYIWECNAWSSSSFLWQSRKCSGHWGHLWATIPAGMACLHISWNEINNFLYLSHWAFYHFEPKTCFIFQ